MSTVQPFRARRHGPTGSAAFHVPLNRFTFSAFFSGATLSVRVGFVSQHGLVDGHRVGGRAELRLQARRDILRSDGTISRVLIASDGSLGATCSPTGSLTLRGRRFSAEELETIRSILSESPSAHRFELSKRICRELDWLQPNGRLKDRSCRDVLARLEAKGLIKLPARRRPSVRRQPIGLTERTEPRPAPAVTPREVDRTCFSIVTGTGDRGQERLWNEYVERYHPLGYGVPLGSHIKYFVRWKDEIVSCLAFGGAAWKLQARDQWIGWSPDARQCNLSRVVNNTRFLILPWVQTPNLASRILGLAACRLREDWDRLYAYRPVLLETFVEAPRYLGSCYLAANWQCLGLTKGRGRMDRHFQAEQSKKRVLVYPLVKDARRILCESTVPGMAAGGGIRPLGWKSETDQVLSRSCRGGAS